MYQILVVFAVFGSMLIATAAMAQSYSYDPVPVYHSHHGQYWSHRRMHDDRD